MLVNSLVRIGRKDEIQWYRTAWLGRPPLGCCCSMRWWSSSAFCVLGQECLLVSCSLWRACTMHGPSLLLDQWLQSAAVLYQPRKPRETSLALRPSQPWLVKLQLSARGGESRWVTRMKDGRTPMRLKELPRLVAFVLSVNLVFKYKSWPGWACCKHKFLIWWNQYFGGEVIQVKIF